MKIQIYQNKAKKKLLGRAKILELQRHFPAVT